MIGSAICAFAALLGSIIGVLSLRLRASGLAALILPLIPGTALGLLLGHSRHDPMRVLMESVLCFASPVALLYAFHARRKGGSGGWP